MNKRISILQALKGAPSIVRQMRWQFTCPTCGRDNGMTNQPPLRARCVSLGCDTEIGAETNPLWTTTSKRSSYQTTGAHRAAPAGSFATTPTIENLAASLREMLDCYWGEGDGDEPPHFIRQAQILVENFEAANRKRKATNYVLALKIKARKSRRERASS